MSKFSNKLKKPYFWSIFPIFGAKKFFRKSHFVTHNTTWASSTMHTGKNNEPIWGKLPEGRKNKRTKERKDGQSQIHRTLLTTTGNPKIEFCCHLLVFPNNFVRTCLIKMKIDMLYLMNYTLKHILFYTSVTVSLRDRADEISLYDHRETVGDMLHFSIAVGPNLTMIFSQKISPKQIIWK